VANRAGLWHRPRILEDALRSGRKKSNEPARRRRRFCASMRRARCRRSIAPNRRCPPYRFATQAHRVQPWLSGGYLRIFTSVPRGQSMLRSFGPDQPPSMLTTANKGDDSKMGEFTVIVTFESLAFPGVFLRMDPHGVDKPLPSGGGTVNGQFGAGQLERFKMHVLQQTIAITDMTLVGSGSRSLFAPGRVGPGSHQPIWWHHQLPVWSRTAGATSLHR
jgi:hypothetical protein